MPSKSWKGIFNSDAERASGRPPSRFMGPVDQSTGERDDNEAAGWLPSAEAILSKVCRRAGLEICST
eukprot:2535021-Prymnesium_polylepis.1